MDTNRHIWRCWARNLQRWGVSAWIAAVLEASGPLTVVGAQMLYFCQPFFRSIVNDQDLEQLALLLEDQRKKQEFIDLLHGEPSP